VNEGQVKLLVDKSPQKVAHALFFLKENYVRFWMTNEDFKSRYKQLYEAGYKDGFRLFCMTAKQIDAEKRKASEQGLSFDFDFKTSKDSIRAMERRFSDGYDDRCSDPRLEFLPNRLSCGANSVHYWLMIPEFVDEIQNLMRNGTRVDDRTVYPIMVSIYKQKESLLKTSGKDSVRFHFPVAKRAIRDIETAIGIADPERMKFDSDFK